MANKPTGYSWITYENVRLALDRLRIKSSIDGIQMSLSKNYYVIDPNDWIAWDLKVVVKVASLVLVKEQNNALEPLESYDFSPGLFPEKIRQVGFPILQFRKAKHRQLGVNDSFDPKDFDDEHSLLLPNGTVEENGYLPISGGSSTTIASTVPRFSTTTLRFIRNPSHVWAVLQRAQGRCESCRNRSFKTLVGDWFLEVHHKKWLSEGGPDTVENMVALCPNCHRQEHHGTRKYR